MGGLFGGSESTTTQQRITETTTTTNMGDIGFTGQAAVDLAAIIEAGGIAREQIQADVMDSIAQATGAGWNQLVGGASDLVRPVFQEAVPAQQIDTADMQNLMMYFMFAALAVFLAFKVFK